MLQHWIVALGILWGWCAPVSSQAQMVETLAASVEYEVKAAFIHNFAKFIEWPAEAFENKSDPIRIGFLGDGPINEPLMRLTGKEVQNRPLVVSRVQDINQVGSYHIIFVNPSQKKWSAAILKSLKGTGILTVGDMDGFAHQCGIINFYLEKGRVRFEINVSAAARENLKLSSKLLRLARIVDTPCD